MTAAVSTVSGPDGQGPVTASRRPKRKWRRHPLVGAVARRVARLIAVLLLVSFGTFMLMQLAPENPAVAELGTHATPAEISAIDHQLGLDRPIFMQYREWVWRALQGDLGKSFLPPSPPVTQSIGAALPVSLELAVLGEVLAVLVAIPVGVWSAYKETGVFDRISSGLSFAFLSVPVFVSSLVLALLFAFEVRLLPRTGWVRLTSPAGPLENLRYALLPSIALALPLAAVYTRLLRTDMSRTLREDYIQVARAKGLSIRRVLFRHALRPSSISLITISGVSLGYLIGGTVIVETIFGLPGIGRILVTAVGSSDYPLVQGIVLVLAVVYVFVNVLVDLLYSVLDPRIRNVRA
jgi:peptide/nickel transport system permease protein